MKDQNDHLTGELLPSIPTRRGRGRPSVHANAAAKQKAYRERLKANGVREVHIRIAEVRGDTPLRSEIIDLSEVRWRHWALGQRPGWRPRVAGQLPPANHRA